MEDAEGPDSGSRELKGSRFPNLAACTSMRGDAEHATQEQCSPRVRRAATATKKNGGLEIRSLQPCCGGWKGQDGHRCFQPNVPGRAVYAHEHETTPTGLHVSILLKRPMPTACRGVFLGSNPVCNPHVTACFSS